MPMPVYPAELPNPLRDGYSYEIGDGRFRSPSEGGLPNFRRRLSSVPDKVSFATILDQWRYGIFKQFFMVATKRGALPFQIANHVEDGYAMRDGSGNIVLDGGGAPVLVTSMTTAVFDQMPSIRSRGIDWHVSFTLLVTPA